MDWTTFVVVVRQPRITPCLPVDPALGAERDDRIPPVSLGKGANRAMRVAICEVVDELLRDDRIVDKREQPTHGRTRPVEVTDHRGPDFPGAAHCAERLSRKMPVDHQHAARSDRAQIEIRHTAFECAAVGNHEAPLPAAFGDQHDGDGGLRLAR